MADAVNVTVVPGSCGAALSDETLTLLMMAAEIGKSIDFVSSGAPAAQFVARYRDEIFPGVPILMTAVDVRLAPRAALRERNAQASRPLSHATTRALASDGPSRKPAPRDPAASERDGLPGARAPRRDRGPCFLANA